MSANRWVIVLNRKEGWDLNFICKFTMYPNRLRWDIINGGWRATLYKDGRYANNDYVIETNVSIITQVKVEGYKDEEWQEVIDDVYQALKKDMSVKLVTNQPKNQKEET